jgi:hypothetical protein
MGEISKIHSKDNIIMSDTNLRLAYNIPLNNLDCTETDKLL